MLRLFALVLLVFVVSGGIASSQSDVCKEAVVELTAALIAFLGVNNRLKQETCYRVLRTMWIGRRGRTREGEQRGAAQSVWRRAQLEDNRETANVLRKQQERLRGCARTRN